MNLAALVLLLILAEVLSYLYAFYVMKKANLMERPWTPKIGKMLAYPGKIISFGEYYKQLVFRPAEGLKYPRKRPIVIFGCSYAYGAELEEKRTLGYKLARLTKRPVYNRAFSGWGVQHMYWQLENEPFLNEIKDPEYVIYVYVDDQARRLNHSPVIYREGLADDTPYLQYQVTKHGLKENKLSNSFLFNSFFLKGLWYAFGTKFYEFSQINQRLGNIYFNRIKAHFTESEKLIQQKYPGAKTVILLYDCYYNGFCMRLKELEQDGFIVLDTHEIIREDLSDDVLYKVWDGHPNGRAWDAVVPVLAEKLGL